MTRRKYPQFFDQKPSLAMLDYAAKQEANSTRLGRIEPRKVKSKPFMPCEKCEVYSPKKDGSFGCSRIGKCINI